jgi:hypothetical protein
MKSDTNYKPNAITGEIVHIPFDDSEVLAVEIDGKPHIILRAAIESIGLDYSTQLQKLKGRSWATMGHCPTVAEDGKVREMATVDVRTFLMLLATVDERRVSDEVRPRLIKFQAEVADAIEAYFTKGGAISPSATTDQLSALISNAEGQMRILQLANGLVDAHWLEAKTRHVVARALGEEPEVAFDTRPLTVGEYLDGKGVTGAALRSMSTGFGKRLKGLYIEEHGHNPPKVERFVDGALRSVAGYTEADRPLFDRVYDSIVAVPR